MAFIFNTANNEINSGALDILNGLFDIFVVVSIPNQNFNTVSQLTIASNYIPVLLSNNFTSSIWNFNNIILPLTSYPIPPIGFVIAKRLNSNSEQSDPVIYYSEFTNSIGQTINYNTGLYRINIEFNTNGLINFTATNEYFSGVYINNETVPKGMIYLLGSSNNTTLYNNVHTSGKLNSRYKFGSTTGFGGNTSVDRTVNNFGGTLFRRITYDFGSIRKIRVGTFGFYTNQTNNNPIGLYGSNYLTAFTDTEIDTAIWDLIGTVNSLTANNWIFINNDTNNTNYYRWIKLETINNADTIDYGEIEFYNSSIITNSANMV